LKGERGGSVSKKIKTDLSLGQEKHTAPHLSADDRGEAVRLSDVHTGRFSHVHAANECDAVIGENISQGDTYADGQYQQEQRLMLHPTDTVSK